MRARSKKERKQPAKQPWDRPMKEDVAEWSGLGGNITVHYSRCLSVSIISRSAREPHSLQFDYK